MDIAGVSGIVPVHREIILHLFAMSDMRRWPSWPYIGRKLQPTLIGFRFAKKKIKNQKKSWFCWFYSSQVSGIGLFFLRTHLNWKIATGVTTGTYLFIVITPDGRHLPPGNLQNCDQNMKICSFLVMMGLVVASGDARNGIEAHHLPLESTLSCVRVLKVRIWEWFQPSVAWCKVLHWRSKSSFWCPGVEKILSERTLKHRKQNFRKIGWEVPISLVCKTQYLKKW